MVLPASAADFYREQQRKTAAVLQAAKTIWGARPPRDFDAWFARNVDALVGVVMTGQQAVIGDVGDYVEETLAELDFDPEVLARPDPSPLVGVASDGRPLDSLLYGSIITTKGTIAQATSVNAAVISQAWETGLRALMMRVQLQVADASRAATSLEITSRRDTGYVRMLNPPSCSRCVILAGRFYRFSAGFDRHPGCDCRHVPAAQDMESDLRTDPMFQFLAMTEPMQDKVFTRAGAEAIRAGADINQVVNARRGMSTTQTFGRVVASTSEGTTRRGVAYRAMAEAGYARRQTDVRASGERYFRAKAPRLMPEAILEIAEDRDDALRLLTLNGYILDAPVPARRPAVGARRFPGAVNLDAGRRTPADPAPTPAAQPARRGPVGFGAEDSARIDQAVALQVQRSRLQGGNPLARSPEIDALTARLDAMPLSAAGRKRSELLTGNENSLTSVASTPEDADRLVAMSQEGLRLFAADKDVAVNVPSESVLGSILADGRLRSQRDPLITETGGAAGYVPEQRELMETAWFGEHDEPPIYGYLRDRSGKPSGADEYGDIALVLAPRMKDSSKVVVGDSLDEAVYTFPGSLDRPGRFAANPTEAAEFGSAQEYADHLNGVGAAGDSSDAFSSSGFYADYHVEAQILGGVRVTDIDLVHFRGDPPSADIVEQLRAAGIRFTTSGQEQ